MVLIFQTFLLAGGAFIYFRSGGNTVTKQVIDTYKERIAQLEERRREDRKDFDDKMAKERQDITQLTKELSHLKGVLEQKEKDLERYVSIVQGRDPQSIEWSKTIMAVATQASAQLPEILGDLAAIRLALNVPPVKATLPS
jgi:chromosome segregation ATPase